MVTVVFRDDVEGMASRLISTPMNANGAQLVTAHGMPQMPTRSVANRTDFAKGANIIVTANTMCEIIQAVCRSGRTKEIFLRKRTTPRGGRGVKRPFLFSGERTANGRTTELNSVIKEKITSDRLPKRPTLPRASFDCSAADSGAS